MFDSTRLTNAIGCTLRLRGGGRPEMEKVCIIGSGNWGCAIARVIARNVASLDSYHTQVRMWVYQEVIDGRNLTDIINTDHENPKYRSCACVVRLWACTSRG